MLVLWGRKTHIEDLLIAWQTHCTMQVTKGCDEIYLYIRPICVCNTGVQLFKSSSSDFNLPSIPNYPDLLYLPSH